MLFLLGTQRCESCGGSRRAVWPVHVSDEFPCPFCGECAAHPVGPCYRVDMSNPRQADVADSVEAAVLTVRHLLKDVIVCPPS